MHVHCSRNQCSPTPLSNRTPLLLTFPFPRRNMRPHIEIHLIQLHIATTESAFQYRQGAGQGRKGRSVKQLVTGSPCPSLSPYALSLPSLVVSLTIIAYFLTWHKGAGLRLIVLVCSCTTRLSAACNMYLPFFSLSAPCHGVSFSFVYNSPAPAPAPTLAPRFTCSNCHWSV